MLKGTNIYMLMRSVPRSNTKDSQCAALFCICNYLLNTESKLKVCNFLKAGRQLMILEGPNCLEKSWPSAKSVG